jgi:hypothetical protein
MNSNNTKININSNNRPFDDEPEFMTLTEGYETDCGVAVFALVGFDYSRVESMYVKTIVWTDADCNPINFATLPFKEQVWLLNDIEKVTKRHAVNNFERAFAWYELKKNVQ